MAQSQFSLAWNAHKRNVCDGLSSFQQNGDFVDMTLAADGHHVKVHQVIIALASPYLKELISSAQCPHPVIFLNKISSSTLTSILEYVYTGEVLVSMESLGEFLEAGKELHIKGLEDMRSSQLENETDCNMESLDDDISYFEVTQTKDDGTDKIRYHIANIGEPEESPILGTEDNTYQEEKDDDDDMTQESKINIDKVQSIPGGDPNMTVMQFTVSNQGSLQMILNRFVYYLKHTNRNNTRQWRCVDYLNNVKCPAHVFTKDDVVVQRISAHVHPFHDKRILKKVHAGAVFSAIHEAEQQRKFRRPDATNSD